MKTTFLALPLLGAALVLSACSTINTRINEKGSVYYSLDPATQQKISHGDVALGFTPDMVYMALGRPDEKRQRTSADGVTETWLYGTTYYDSAFVGYRRWGGWGPRGFYRMYWEPVYAPVRISPPEADIRVTFREGKVVSIDQSRS